MANNIQIIKLSGVFDVERAANYYRVLENIVTKGSDIIVIDFENVTFMDSSGLRALIKYLKLTHDAEIRLLLCSLNHQILMLFKLTGMDRVFEIFSGREELKSQVLKTNQ